ncbi:hypothetical protein CHS0354_021518 [Potamilus streckersoni]|uniref:Protein inscuteable homologue C-terminal domain-containing protein n=1 Tax=Potamilus streckersoni TaxID=2493646 RepID=A0AAE0SNV9_9BIVA|nr:hypothetical protein CHS0354_021518 [Potamilus streckersoni]
MDYPFDSVQSWLVCLRVTTEMETMSILQGKSLTQESQMSSKFSIKNSVDTIRNKSHKISNEFSKLFRCIEEEKWKNVRPLILQLTCHIRSLIQECNKCIMDPPLFMLEQQEMVMGECAKLAQQVEGLNVSKGNIPQKVPLVNQLTFLGQSFSKMVDLSLGYLVQKLVDSLDESHTPASLISAINTVISMGLAGEDMCFIMAREGSVRALFEICKTESLEFVHVQALRALTTICCMAESILELAKEGGIECLTDILCDTTVSEAVRGEAAGVVAQVTSPYLDNFHHIAGFLENVQDLLGSLLSLCYNTASHEIFLLSTAAISNITFIDHHTCEVLQQLNAPRHLIHCSYTRKAQSIFCKDQIATVLANMAVLDTARNDILRNDGLSVLVSFLQERPSQYTKEAELAACERVQQKAAIALTRLCRDGETAQVIIDLHGIPRLVQLCRNIKERNNSDAVLVANLAALRKICSLCQTPDMTLVDFQQLIKPQLMDSFLMCSRTDENFV